MDLTLEILICILTILVSISILVSFRFGYNLGNKVSKETMNELSRTAEENIFLKKKALVTNDIVVKYYKEIKEKTINDRKNDFENIEDFENKALKNAFGEYGDMFKEDIKEFENGEIKEEEMKI